MMLHMLDYLFSFLTKFDEIFWGYIAFVLIILLGFYLTIQTRFFQIRKIPLIFKAFVQFLYQPSDGKPSAYPLKTFFATTGGMIGIGNVAGIVTAVQLGGPGALFWVWVAGIIGAILKYCEIYLGYKYRMINKEGGFDGGPMYYLNMAFRSRLLPLAVAMLLCVYAVEIYQFSVITESVSSNWHLDRIVVIIVLLTLVLVSALGGLSRIGQICVWVMPLFLVLYFAMGMSVIIQEFSEIPALFASVFKSAFTGHAAVGGFAGSSAVLAIQHGIARAAYCSDIGIGYDSIIQSESTSIHPQRQARRAVFGVFIDNMICSFSILLVLISGVWKSVIPLDGSELVQVALGNYFPYMQFFMPFFFIIVGFSTIIAYFVVGVKCASFLFPKWGKKFFIVYGSAAFIFFSYVPQFQALLIMSASGAILLVINLLGIFRLRKEIAFDESDLTYEDV